MTRRRKTTIITETDRVLSSTQKVGALKACLKIVKNRLGWCVWSRQLPRQVCG